VQRDIVRTASNIDKSWIGLNAADEIAKRTSCPTHVVNDVDAAGLAEMKFGAGKKQAGVTIVLAAGTGIGSAIFVDGVLVPNMELGFIHVKGMPGEYYASNSVREAENLSWEAWGLRFNEYLIRLESLFWPDLFILGGGVSKDFEEYEKFFSTDTKVVSAKAKNNAGIIGAALAAKAKFRS
jgi:polyphosphate glucokinase